MEAFLTHFTYGGMVLLLLGAGVGLPVPEDVTLLTSGYLCAHGLAYLSITIVLALLSVLAADSILFAAGKRYGYGVLKIRAVGRLISLDRLGRAEDMFARHGGKTLVAARFLPGLRAVFFLSAGLCGVPYRKFLVYDGAAAMITVPGTILLGWYFADRIDAVLYWERRAQLVLVFGIIVIAAAFFLLRRRLGRRR